MNYLEYIFFRCLVALAVIVPFRILYLVSDVCAFIMQYLIKYRDGTIAVNLKNAFPEKSVAEIRSITCKFYKHLCDVSLESLKGFYSYKQLLERYKILNPEIANQYFDKNQDIIIAMSHYGNWEWGTQVAGSIYKHKMVSFYKPMANRHIDKLTNNLRSKRSMMLVSINDVKFIFRTKDDRAKAYLLISDQSPGNVKKAVWLKFLHQETACLRGIEDYAKLFNLPVLYADIQKVKRGYYTVFMEEICSTPESTKKGEITAAYMKKLEEIIIKKPEYWLWSHRRWKLKR